MPGSDTPESVSISQKHDPSYLGEAVNLLSASFVKDEGTKSSVEQYGTGLLKTGALFLGGRLGLAATVLTHAADEMHRSDSAGMQALDFVGGALKGAGMRALFAKMPAGADFATKGIVMGTGSRFLDAGLTRRNWFDENGFHTDQGVKAVKDGVFNKSAWTADIVTFGLAHGSMVGINRLTGNFLERSPMLTTMLTGGTFGMSTGAYAEIQRQQASGQELDLGKIARGALIQGGLDAVAAAPGGLQADRALRGNLAEAAAAKRDALSQRFTTIKENLAAGIRPKDLALSMATAGTVPAIAEHVAQRPVTEAPVREIPLQELLHAEKLQPPTLQKVVSHSVDSAKPTLRFFDAPAVVPETIHEMALRSTPEERRQVLLNMRAVAQAPYRSSEEAKVSAAYEAAAAIGKVDPELYRREFFEPLRSEIHNRDQHYAWRVFAASRFAGLERSGRLPIELGNEDIPNLRMNPVPLDPPFQTDLRERTESALHNPRELVAMLGEHGDLGKLFPEVFGSFRTEGGIMGRPQHDGHDFTVSAHTLKVLSNIRSHPEFARLAEKDQTNLLWAALMHDVGKRPNMYDPWHEPMSYNAAWGVLQTMGYNPQRIHRITDLMYRHSDMSFNPERLNSDRLQDPYQLDETSVLYRHEPAVQQLRILNESDIRAVRQHDSLWRPEVKDELDNITAKTGNAAWRLSTNLVPVLTADLPKQFGVYDLPADASVLVHNSPYMANGEFFRHLSLIESPHFSGSASLVNKRHLDVYDPRADFVAIFSAPPEHVSQAHRTGLWTSEQLGWNGHVILTREWANSQLASDFAREAEAKLKPLGMNLEEYRRRLGQYDTVDEMRSAEGADSPLMRAHEAMVESYTQFPDGRPTGTFNEFKVNNPAVSGIGIMSHGRKIAFEGATNGGAIDPATTLVIPKFMWQEAQRRNLPFLILDSK